MSDSITFKYIQTKEDYWRAVRATWRAGLSRWFVWASGALAAAVVVFAVYGLTRSWYGVEIFIGIIPVLIMQAGASWWIVSNYRKITEFSAPLGDAEIEGAAGEEGITLDYISEQVRVPWKGIVAAMETPDDFLLYEKFSPIGVVRFYYIPKRAFVGAAGLADFRELSRRNIPNFRTG
ncbi:MAG: YcxB family protein [Alphaproteobacteria bacterium]|nr:YcxB family protein [Alphaproteobacteria bacterium]